MSKVSVPTASDKPRRSPRGAKPAKPDGSPLTPHWNGQWVKKVLGQQHRFGTWRIDGCELKGHAIALAKWEKQKDDLLAGRVPKDEAATGPDVDELCNKFLRDKQILLDKHQFSKREFKDLKTVCQRVIGHFGRHRALDDIKADDFSRYLATFPSTWGPTRIGKEVQRTRTVFNYADPDNLGLVGHAISFGPLFKKPSQETMRAHELTVGERDLPPEEILALLGEAKPRLYAMILLGINCAFEPHDCAKLTLDKIDLDGGWHNFPRPKEHVARRCPLWPETVEALRKALASMPKPKNPEAIAYMNGAQPVLMSELVFITKYGNAYWDDEEGKASAVFQEYGKAANSAGVSHSRFLGLRHSFNTVTKPVCSQIVIDTITGHLVQENDMARRYGNRNRLDDAALRYATNAVRSWLFNAGEQMEPGAILKFQATG